LIHIFKLIFFLLITYNAFSQEFKIIQKSIYSDSSYYDICKINENECWIGGENGVLKSIDNNGNIKNIPYEGKKESILKIVKANNYIYLAADNGTIYIYNIENKQFIKKKFSGKLSKCSFYDLIILDDGSIIACGGNSKIAKGEKSIPNGFIIRFDYQCNNKPEFLWANKKCFVFSLTKSDKKGEIFASAYNGVKSIVLKSNNNGAKWDIYLKLNALIHEISFIDSNFWYCGSKNHDFTKNGVIGNVNNEHILKDMGCIWNLLNMNNKIYAFSKSGNILFFDKATNNINTSINPLNRPLYQSVIYLPNKAYIVGSGGGIIQLYNAICLE